MSSSTVETHEALAIHLEVSGDTLSVELADGRTIAAPLAWYPRLAHASAEERETWRLLGGGRGIHWPALDEDITRFSAWSFNTFGSVVRVGSAGREYARDHPPPVFQTAVIVACP